MSEKTSIALASLAGKLYGMEIMLEQEVKEMQNIAKSHQKWERCMKALISQLNGEWRLSE